MNRTDFSEHLIAANYDYLYAVVTGGVTNPHECAKQIAIRRGLMREEHSAPNSVTSLIVDPPKEGVAPLRVINLFERAWQFYQDHCMPAPQPQRCLGELPDSVACDIVTFS